MWRLVWWFGSESGNLKQGNNLLLFDWQLVWSGNPLKGDFRTNLPTAMEFGLFSCPIVAQAFDLASSRTARTPSLGAGHFFEVVSQLHHLELSVEGGLADAGFGRLLLPFGCLQGLLL